MLKISDPYIDNLGCEHCVISSKWEEEIISVKSVLPFKKFYCHYVKNVTQHMVL